METYKLKDLINRDIAMFQNDAQIVFDTIKEHQYVMLDLTGIVSCVTSFINTLVYAHQCKHNYKGMIVMFNVTNPMVSVKLHTAYTNYQSDEKAQRYIEFYNNLDLWKTD